jgi:hypothetical protein
MKALRRSMPVWAALLAGLLVCLIVQGCGNDPLRYVPGIAGVPTSITAQAGDARVSLSWAAAANANWYNVYYATTPGVTKQNGTRISGIASTTYTLTGLQNGTTYYFVVAGANASGESAVSAEVSAAPKPGSYSQQDLQGTWNFNALAGKPDAKWMRGTVAVGADGAVSYTSFLDSAGNTVAPSDLLSTLTINGAGVVTQGGGSLFHGFLSSSKILLAGTTSLKGGVPVLMLLQKRVPGVTYSNADISGTGSTPPGTGPLPLAYEQIAVGSREEWEYAVGQAGKDRGIKYSVFLSPSGAVKPGDKASVLSITSDGIVTETASGVQPAPAVVIPYGTMSTDKTMIVGTATDTSGSTPRYVLRITQITQLPGIPLIDYLQADLAGAYGSQRFITTPAWAYGNLTISDSGLAVYSSYSDSTGSSVLPPNETLTVGGNGTLTDPSDSTVHGTLSYFKDLAVITRTESNGTSSLSVLLKR